MFINSVVVAALLAMSSKDNDQIGTVTGLYRHAVKGLSADVLEKVHILKKGETFPDDRRFGLLKSDKKFDTNNPEWLHKENFLCAFTAPQLMAKYQTSYQIISKDEQSSYALPCDSINAYSDTTQQVQRLLTVRDRASQDVLLGPIDLNHSEERERLASFFSQASNEDVKCVCSSLSSHEHQFGNTSSGVKQNKGDTRTLHLVNMNTVQSLSDAIGKPLNPTRFRPNIVLEGPEAWSEFDWIGTTIKVGGLTLKVISKTVRCDGVSVDPTDPETVLDIPKLLVKHFPEYGPFLGVYAVVVEPGKLLIGDGISLQKSLKE